MESIMDQLSTAPGPDVCGIFPAERKRAIVFGGAGFIGSHLLQTLAAAYPDADLYSVDKEHEPRFHAQGVHYVEHDITKAIPSQLCGAGPALIFNLAAVHTTPGHEDWEYYNANILGACNVCRYATETGAQRIVFTSSIAVYGPGEEPRDEDSELTPVSAYGRSKMMAESIHELWQSERADERHLTVVRPAVIYGSTERGNFTRLANLLAKKRFIYPGRKDTIKSCGYVKDLVSSMLFFAAKPDAKIVYNFCYPQRFTTEDICAAFSEAAGYEMPRMVAPIDLMLLGGFGFEVLSKLGVKTKINRARVKKLYHSTNIVPRRLQDEGFRFGYPLKESLTDWQSSSPTREFV
jgi:GlcNAc-P-P-Und epimerase